MKKLIVLLLAATASFGQSNNIVVNHYDAAFCQQTGSLGIPGQCRENVMVMVGNQDASKIDSVKVTLTFTRAGLRGQKTERVEVNQAGYAFAFFALANIKVESVTVIPLGAIGEPETITR